MSRRYRGIPLDELKREWEEKRRRIADLPLDERTPSDLEELFYLRKEIEKREDEKLPPKDIDFAAQYVTK